MFSEIYNNCPVLLTGHTGFKGSWLALWLTELKAQVVGFSINVPTTPSHWDLLNLDCQDERGDVRDFAAVNSVISRHKPRIVFHLAAQPLVRRSYRDPLETWSTNVIGTANILEACRLNDCVRAVVVVTTDKCYENQEQIWGYRECDPLGGHDPYSGSKAAAELVVASYRKSYFDYPDAPLIATARAGNVIGGGDWSADRLIPDAARAVATKESLEIRSPNATRPWQHVLDCLAGYLLLGQRLLLGKKEYADAWNFGPGRKGNRTVTEVLNRMQEHWPNLQWHQTSSPQLHETILLQLDSTRANSQLSWHPVWPLEKALESTAEWYHLYIENGNLVSSRQLSQYISDARLRKHAWALS
jgi:CDP-glucose 4,6-dehydratase